MIEPHYRVKGANFSDDRKYRYLLWRLWDPEKPTITFILLNPSTADEKILDPTLRRCLGFAMDMGYGRMDILNLFALRSTNPQVLYDEPDPVGKENNSTLLYSCGKSNMIIAGWGVHGVHKKRDQEVIDLLTSHGKTLHCLKLTDSGLPHHPLYLKKTLRPILFKIGASS